MVFASLMMLLRVLDGLENFQDRVILSENYTAEERMFTFETYALQIQEVDSETYLGQTFVVDLGSIEDVSSISGRIPNDSLVLGNTIMKMFSNATASVQLPEDLFDDLVACNRKTSSATNTSSLRRLSYSVFLSDVLFQSINVNRHRLGSIIVAARVNCGVDTSLNTSILATFSTNKTVRLLCWCPYTVYTVRCLIYTVP